MYKAETIKCTAPLGANEMCFSLHNLEEQQKSEKSSFTVS